MATINSNAINKQAVTNYDAGEVIAIRASASTTSSLAAADLLKMVTLPAGYIITGGYLAATNLDTGTTPTITLTVGLMDVGDTALDSGTDLLTASTVGQAGTLEMFDTGLTQGPFDVDKIVAVKVVAAAATKAAGTVYCQVEYAQP
jgi:hypothetical protein